MEVQDSFSVDVVEGGRFRTSAPVALILAESLANEVSQRIRFGLVALCDSECNVQDTLLVSAMCLHVNQIHLGWSAILVSEDGHACRRFEGYEAAEWE